MRPRITKVALVLCRAFTPSDAASGSLLSDIGPLQTEAVQLSPVEQYILLLEGNQQGPTTALFSISNFGTGTAGLPGVSCTSTAC